MKILIYSQPAFADTIFPLIKEFQSHGHDVTCLMSLNYWECHCTIFNIENQPKRNGIIVATQLPELSIYKDYINLDKLFFINRVTRGYSLSTLKLAIDVLLFMKQGGFDIVHLDNDLRMYNVVQYLYPKPFVFIVHDPIPHSGDENTELKIFRYIAFKRANHFVLLNRMMKDAFCKKYGISQNKISFNFLSVYNCLSVHKKRMYEENSHSLLFFGRINPYKGIEYLCDAMSIIVEKYPNSELIIAGKGKLYFDVNKYSYVKEIKIVNRFIPDTELVDFIEKSAIVVCPYTEATQSGVIMTAFNFCKPVICTQVGGLPEMIENGKTGLIVKPKNAQELVNAVDFFFSNEEEKKKMKENIYQEYHIGKKSWHEVMNKYLEIYNKVINIK